MSQPFSGFLDSSLPPPGYRFNTDIPVLLNQQAPSNAPDSADSSVVSNPLMPAATTSSQLAHFFEGVYDLSPDSHLTRLVSTILGDACMGMISKQYTQARMGDVLLTTHFSDLDRLYGDVFGLHRLQNEILPFNPFTDQATPEAWANVHARDSSYRARIEQFARGLNMGGTAQGMEVIAEAILACPVQVYETWSFVDLTTSSPGGLNSGNVGPQYYSAVERLSYAELERQSHADLEGNSGSYGRTTSTNRGEFVVRPLRPISLEENYQLIRTLTRIKPAEALLTVSSAALTLHKRVSIRNVAADSTFWQVKAVVNPPKAVLPVYNDPNSHAYVTFGTGYFETYHNFAFTDVALAYGSFKSNPTLRNFRNFQQLYSLRGETTTGNVSFDSGQNYVPRVYPAFGAYQGAHFNYNSDVVGVLGYTQRELVVYEDHLTVDTIRNRWGIPKSITTQEPDQNGQLHYVTRYETGFSVRAIEQGNQALPYRFYENGGPDNWLRGDVDRLPINALATSIFSGRLVSDGVLVSPPYLVDRFSGAVTTSPAFREGTVR